MTLPPLVEAMLDPSFYPHRPAQVSLAQTHISYVFLAGSEVFKIKKPVSFRFLDFSTLDLRREVCREEVRLNRRLAPETYLGVVGVKRAGSTFALAAEEDPAAIEYAVHMRRLPDDRFLTNLIEHGQLTEEMIDELAARLAAFHAAARSDAAVTASGAPEAIARVAEDSFATARRFRTQSISPRDDDRIQGFLRGFLESERPRLEQRMAEGRIRECHGDLHGEHVCFTTPLVIFDCIEFSESLRCCDVASEIAFLAMDLTFRGREDLAEHFVGCYAERSGDFELPGLVPFYACYRAYVRGMVDSLAAGEPEMEERERPVRWESARRHFLLSQRYAWAYRSGLVVLVGLSGSGKSNVAAALAERTGFRSWSSDVERKRLAGLDLVDRAGREGAKEIYSPQFSARTYAALYENAERHLAAGRGVILDATFLRRIDRDRARALTSRLGKPILIVECRCDEDEIRRRLERREVENTDPSDADLEIHMQQRRVYEPTSGDEPATMTVDTTGGIDAALELVEARLLEVTQQSASLHQIR